MVLTLTILQQGQDYIFTWDLRPDTAGSDRPDDLRAATRRLAVTHLDAQQQADLQSAIDLAAQVAHQLAEPGARGPAALQSLERLGRVMFSQLLPAALQEVLRELPPATPLLLTTNDARLPWELLHDDRDFLALRHAVGRRLLAGEDVRKNPRAAHDRLACLIIGNPTGDLPAADSEVEALIDVLDAAPRRVRADLLCREQASKVRVLEALAGGQYDVVHYAGHARPGALRLADGWLEADEIRTALRGQPLIFLNACASAREEVAPPETDFGLAFVETLNKSEFRIQNSEFRLPYAGQQARNLASAFLLGGASAFVGTLWPVFDESARQLATDFYRAVIRGQPAGEALRLARTRCRQHAPGETVWAAPVLYADPLYRVVTSGLSFHSGTVLVAQLPDPLTRWQAGPIESAARTVHHEVSRLVRAIIACGGQVIAPGTSQIAAVFGVPRTFEDDAERAVRAALDIQRATAEWEAGQPAIGVASGEIVVDQPPGASDTEPLHLGPAVTEALYLASQARPGQVLAGAITHKLAQDAFHFAPMAEAEGIGAAYEVSPARRTLHVQTFNVQTFLRLPEPQPADPTLVGRAEELAALASYWQAARQGRGQVVGIVGEAGIGKSRLLQTFKHTIADDDHTWLEATCPSTGHDVPYTLLTQLLHSLLDIAPDDDDVLIDRISNFEFRISDLPLAAHPNSKSEIPGRVVPRGPQGSPRPAGSPAAEHAGGNCPAGTADRGSGRYALGR